MWRRATRGGDRRVIVVAALQEIAQAMSQRAAQLGGQISKSHLDQMFSAAEQQTAALMAAALEKEGLAAEVVPYIRGRALTWWTGPRGSIS